MNTAALRASPRTLLRLGRVSNLPTVWTNVLAATVVAGGSAASPGTVTALAAMTLFYLGGMYLNDAFDREIDRRERPSRPIPAGEISARAVFAGGWLMLAGGFLLMATRGLVPAFAGGALAGMIVLYDINHKGNAFSPIVMGLCRALVYVGTALATVGTISAAVLAGAAALLAHIVGLTYAAKQESLDRVERLWPLAILAVPLLFYAVPAADDLPSLAMWGLLAVAVGAAVWVLVRHERPGAVPRAVGALIAAISLLDGLIAAVAGAWPVVLVCLGAYALTRFLHRIVPGT